MEGEENTHFVFNTFMAFGSCVCEARAMNGF